MRIQSNVGVVDIIGHIVIWFFLILFTFGIALFFFPYSFSKFIINRSELTDDAGFVQPMHCETEMFGRTGHIILWMIISLFTLGLGYAFYFYKVWSYSLNNTHIGHR
jgi:uncharacterized membrane protein YjgN (DUF898 family)